MEEQEKISWDETAFYWEGKPFFPCFSEEAEGNCVAICITPSESGYQELLAKARAVSENGKKILWVLDSGFHQKFFLRDGALFHSLRNRMEEIGEKVILPLKDSTFAISVYRGSVYFSSRFLFSAAEEDLYRERKEEYAILSEEERHLFFCADIFLEYLQRLTAFLPDAVPVLCQIRFPEEIGIVKGAYLCSKDRFGHLLPVFEGVDPGFGYSFSRRRGNAPSEGICLPPFASIDEEGLCECETYIEQRKASGALYRIVPEEYLHEMSAGLEELRVFSRYVTDRGMRKLRGFLASGGVVVDKEGAWD